MVDELKTVVVGDDEVVSSDDITEVSDARQQLTEYVEQCLSFSIESKQDYLKADEMLRQLKAVYKLLEDVLEPMRKETYAHYKRVLGYKQEVLGEGDAAIDYLSDQMVKWTRQQEEAAREERQQQIEQMKQGERDSLPSIDDGVPDVEGTYYRDNWKARLESDDEEACLRTLCKAVAEGDVAPHLVSVDWSEANKLARRTQTAFSVPGLESWNDKVLVQRSES